MNTDLGKRMMRSKGPVPSSSELAPSIPISQEPEAQISDQTDTGFAVRQKLLTPFRQGALDSYCGIYAIANALNRAKPSCLNDEAACELFLTLIKAATKVRGGPDFCNDGLDDIELRQVAKVGVRLMRKMGHAFETVTLKSAIPGMPYKRNQKQNWFDHAARADGLSVIVYVEKPSYCHWSVLKATESGRLTLFDSDKMRSARWDECEPYLVLRAKQHF